MRKQLATHAGFVGIRDAAAARVPLASARALVERTADEVRATLEHLGTSRAGYGWSGGKDSQALRVVLDAAGVFPSVLGVAHDLEIPAFLAWVEQHRPANLHVVDNGWGLETLAEKPCLLFPTAASVAYRWFAGTQHFAQNLFTRQFDLDVLILGRRLEDGNQTGDHAGGFTRKRENGRELVRYNPIRKWSHEEVFAVCHHYGMALPPFYDYPRGFVVGTGPWPKRRVPNHDQGWSEVFSIDPAIVVAAAAVLPEAALWLQNHAH